MLEILLGLYYKRNGFRGCEDVEELFRSDQVGGRGGRYEQDRPRSAWLRLPTAFARVWLIRRPNAPCSRHPPSSLAPEQTTNLNDHGHCTYHRNAQKALLAPPHLCLWPWS